MKAYGVTSQNKISTLEELHIEDIQLKGFSIMRNVLNNEELELYRNKLDKLNEIQKKETGEDLLIKLNENNTVRLPLFYDNDFINLISKNEILTVIKRLVGDFVILHLQNGIINYPSIEHHQSSWHRDLPYQDFTISRPIAVSVLYCIDDFNVNTGGTLVLPFSHKINHLPSKEFIENNELTVNAKAGDVIIFDSMLYHRAGFNISGKIRRGINNIYTIPLIKQQINIPSALGGKFEDDEKLSSLLGYTCQTPDNVSEYRKQRQKKISGK